MADGFADVPEIAENVEKVGFFTKKRVNFRDGWLAE